jgi:hypothetical protein
MKGLVGILAALALALPAFGSVAHTNAVGNGKHHHKHHHGKHHKGKHHHGKHHKKEEPAAGPTKEDKKTEAPVAAKPKAVVKAAVQPAVQPAVKAAVQVSTESSIVDKMRQLEAKLSQKAKAQAEARSKGHILVNGPLPSDFSERFSQAVAQSTGTEAKKVTVTDSTAVDGNTAVVEVAFEAPPKVVKSIEAEAADPESKLAKGNMHSFLVSKDDAADEPEKKEEKEEPAPKQHAHEEEQEATPVESKGIDIDTQMPYGDLEPFGREDTAQELTESSVKESDSMVDQLERAEVAEEKRAVFRALTRLRGAAITSFDGVARSQTGNIDEYNKIHKWRNSHPLHHLADEESDISKWAFPDNADF